jgi:hypothetical protein
MLQKMFALAGLLFSLMSSPLWAQEPRIKVYGSLSLTDTTHNTFDPAGFTYEALRRRQIGTPYYLTSSAQKEVTGNQFGIGAQLRISGGYWFDLHWQKARSTEITVDTHIDSLLREEEICPFVPPCFTVSTWSSEDQKNHHRVAVSALSLGIKKDLIVDQDHLLLAPGVGWHITQIEDQATADYTRIVNTIPTPGIRRTEKTSTAAQTYRDRLHAPYLSLDTEVWPAGKDGPVGIGVSAKWFVLGVRTHTVNDRSLIDDLTISTRRPRWHISLHASLGF